MQLTIGHKIFLALLLSAGSTLIVMALLVQWSLGRGFLDYINQVESERLAVFADHLTSIYVTRRDWLWLRDNPRALQHELKAIGQVDQAARERPPRPNPEDRRFRPPRPPDGRAPPPPPPHRRGRPPPDPLQLHHRLTIFDHQQQPIIGRTRFTEAVNLTEITVEEQTVGWLALQPLQRVTAGRDVQFLRRQSQMFLLIGSSLIALAALVALILARHLTRPLRRLTQAVQYLVAGDYSIRADINGRDEIATLGQRINTLAHTLEANEETRRRWIADISHELRTPLTVVRGELEALEDGVRTFNYAALGSLHNEIQGLSKLVNDLHELSLSDLGALSYRRQPLDLADVLSQVMTSFNTRIQSHQLSLQHNIEHSPRLSVYGDRSRLQQLFSNLLENAIRYTDPGGRIELSVTENDEMITVRLDDSPPGVPAEDCPRLFERLYRMESSRSRSHGGSGLGLAICRNIVTAHEGIISAQPSLLGGLSVIVELPIYRA
ncbi:MAG: ATP-binding protein [Candidatus Competibacteraceae bacterium]|jgi:two-component system sensor histidine kinase BaeS|nr:ATP-binding protein [Candidatus Competibacteraceae bacterium]